LDVDLNLKISDFSGSSLDGSLAMVCPGSRYAAPDPNWKPGKIPVAGEDVFALGLTIYHIVKGKAPFEDLSDDQVEQNFLRGVFPELDGLPYADLITLCWQQRVTALDIIQYMDRLIDS
jgi:serine/threonine protein kinase